MLNVNTFVLLCLELNSRRVDSAETNNFIGWLNADNHRRCSSIVSDDDHNFFDDDDDYDDVMFG